MRIQELEHLVGIERATIRFYEKEGLFTPQRQENGYRNYSDDDAAELRRIKLLRELGVGLDTIRNLQAGKEDFAAVMRRQSQILQGRRDQMERARIVCDRISADNATYLGLDTGRYQDLLNAPLLPQPNWQGSGGKVFEERDDRERHPWRRFFARFLDHGITYAVLWFLFIVVLRWRFNYDFVEWLVGCSIWFIQVPIEAAWIHYCGTTPGKWIFGIRVESIEGGKLTYGEALERAWKAYYVGMGLNIPILRLWCFWKGYKAHTDDWDNDWDEYSEVSFRAFNWKNWLLMAVAYAAAIGLGVVSELDSQLPAHRGNLTVAQFAQNYNFYDNLLADDSCPLMYRDGTIQDPEYTQSMLVPDYGELEYDPYDQFEYTLDGNAIASMEFHHTWNERENNFDYFALFEDRDPDSLANWMPTYCRLAMLTAMASQEGITNQILVGYINQFNEDIQQPALEEVTFTYGEVTCTWKIDLELVKEYLEESNYSDIYEVTMDLKIEFP